jgi:hypothetical protein
VKDSSFFFFFFLSGQRSKAVVTRADVVLTSLGLTSLCDVTRADVSMTSLRLMWHNREKERA